MNLLLAALIVWSSPAEAGALVDLDAVPGWGPSRWEAPPRASMVRRGGNGPERAQYVIPGDPNRVGSWNADAITYEYLDGKLGTVILAFKHAIDAEGVLADLTAAYGPPTFEDPATFTKVWRGERVRLVHRQQATDLWVVIYAFLPLHAGDAPDVPSAEPPVAMEAPMTATPPR